MREYKLIRQAWLITPYAIQFLFEAEQDAKKCEKDLQDHFKKLDRSDTTKPGKEWFFTNPHEIINAMKEINLGLMQERNAH